MGAAPSFVTVSCKLPHGLQIKVKDRALTLRGSNAPGAIAGFGFTTIPEDFWNEWKATHKNFAPLVKGLIFAHAKPSSAKAEVNEKKDLRNGLEPLDPKAPIPGIKPASAPKASSDADSHPDFDEEEVA